MTYVAGTLPYAWPYDGRLGGDHVALVLAGWDAHWADVSFGRADAEARCAELAAAVTAIGGRVVAVAHHEAAPLGGPDAHVVGAFGIDGFHQGPLDGLLRSWGVTHLLVAGHGIEGAVHSTLRSANDRGYECLLVTDACSTLTEDLAAASSYTVTMSGGIFGAVGETSAALAALSAQRSVTLQED